MTAAHPFLSENWIEAARAIRAEYEGRAPAPPHEVRMNQVVTDVPFGDGTVHAHLDTTGGTLDIELGHLDDPQLTVTIDYETAKSLLTGGNPQAAMQAFLAGKIRIDGDIAKLMALQQQQAMTDRLALEVAQRIRDITA